jgi:hypothetical protein
MCDLLVSLPLNGQGRTATGPTARQLHKRETTLHTNAPGFAGARFRGEVRIAGVVKGAFTTPGMS